MADVLEDDILAMRRELLYECSIFIRTCQEISVSDTGHNEGDYQQVASKIRKELQMIYWCVLKDEEMETVFCSYLMNCVDIRKHKTELGATEIKDFKHAIADFITSCCENVTERPDKKVKVFKSTMKEQRFREANVTYFYKLWDEKEERINQERPMKWNERTREIIYPHYRYTTVDVDLYEEVLDESEGTLDRWNQYVLDTNYIKEYIFYNDPELKPWTIFRKRTLGEEMFSSGSLRENVVTTLIDHPRFGDTDVDLMKCVPIPGTLHDITDTPGYTRILLRANLTFLPDDATPLRVSTDANNFILSSQLVHTFLQSEFNSLNYDDVTEIPEEEVFESISGPAIASYKDPDQKIKSDDVVYGYYSHERSWPAVAEEWRHRNRTKLSGWPSQDLIDRAISHGTYVVPVAHKNSTNPHIEWRYSFSRAEVDLTESITEKQRKCFMLTKRLCQLVFSGFKLFCSYFIKTSFFWLLEEMEAVYWGVLPMQILVNCLLDKMIWFLSGPVPHLPNYFIRKANLVDHLHRDHIATIRQNLQKLILRRQKVLQQYVLRDVCLHLINDTVQPTDEYITF